MRTKKSPEQFHSDMDLFMISMSHLAILDQADTFTDSRMTDPAVLEAETISASLELADTIHTVDLTAEGLSRLADSLVEDLTMYSPEKVAQEKLKKFIDERRSKLLGEQWTISQRWRSTKLMVTTGADNIVRHRRHLGNNLFVDAEPIPTGQTIPLRFYYGRPDRAPRAAPFYNFVGYSIFGGLKQHQYEVSVVNESGHSQATVTLA